MVRVSAWVFPPSRHFHPWVESLHSCVSPHLLATELPVLMSSAHHDSLPSLQLTTVSAGRHSVSQEEILFIEIFIQPVFSYPQPSCCLPPPSSDNTLLLPGADLYSAALCNIAALGFTHLPALLLQYSTSSWSPNCLLVLFPVPWPCANPLFKIPQCLYKSSISHSSVSLLFVRLLKSRVIPHSSQNFL